ncbi:MAG: OadG family protein [Spirochaetales bacterium]|nr:OadG family protein [Spirochaetales bacterium]
MNDWFIVALGFGTVFSALVALSFVLELFKLIFVGRKKQGHVPSVAPANVIMPAAQAAGGDEGELLAVIAAAVSAASGMSPGSFRVAAVAPVGSTPAGVNVPAWGFAERIARAVNSGRRHA